MDNLSRYCCLVLRVGVDLAFQGLAKMKEKLEAEADLGARVVSVGVSVSWAASVAIE